LTLDQTHSDSHAHITKSLFHSISLGFHSYGYDLMDRCPEVQLMSNVVENLVPYATYRWAEYKAMKADDQIKRETGEKAPESHASRMDKEFLTPKYEASIGRDFEDGLFDGA
jgi:hypothetical protein